MLNIPSHCRGTCGSQSAQTYHFFSPKFLLLAAYMLYFTWAWNLWTPSLWFRRTFTCSGLNQGTPFTQTGASAHTHSTDSAVYLTEKALYLVGVICVEFRSAFLTRLWSPVYSSLSFTSTYPTCAHLLFQGWWAVGQWFSAPISGHELVIIDAAQWT